MRAEYQPGFFERPSVKQAGVVIAALFLGMAIGNGWATQDALKGEGAWWQRYCHQQVQQQLQNHKQADVAKYGY